MAWNSTDASVIISFLDSHHGFDPVWDAERNQGMIAAYWQSDPIKALNAYGGLWDTIYNRQPGADYEGSIQQMYDWILVYSGRQPVSDTGVWHYGAFGNLGNFVPPGGSSKLPSLPSGGTGGTGGMGGTGGTGGTGGIGGGGSNYNPPAGPQGFIDEINAWLNAPPSTRIVASVPNWGLVAGVALAFLVYKNQ